MIAKQPIRFAISIIHLAIAIFCGSFIVMEVFQKGFLAFNGRDKIIFLVLACIVVSAIAASLAWLSHYITTAKKISYILVFSFTFLLLPLLPELKNTSDIISFSMVIATVASFIFLLAFSKITHHQTTIQSTENNSLDADFLASELDKNTNSSIFWKPNHIVAFSSLVFALALFISLTDMGAPSWVISAPSAFFIGSVVLWIFPKIGSWIFSVVSILAAIGITGMLIYTSITRQGYDSSESIKFILFFSVIVGSICLLCIGMAMLLLSKEAQQEWIENKPI
ncbi:hypothetical protein [Bernardetia sp.]|uniref:hypothetical protein n=1 Tax=Bernardetia sp. TaxID=1937974 RepID=UPI0025C537C7|nr:hypothetical protein [Bernardetia sp.]